MKGGNEHIRYGDCSEDRYGRPDQINVRKQSGGMISEGRRVQRGVSAFNHLEREDITRRRDGQDVDQRGS